MTVRPFVRPVRFPAPAPVRRQPSRSPVPVDRRFQKRPVTTGPGADSLPRIMTICIAAMSRDRERIVAVSDMKLSAGDWTSADLATIKTLPIKFAPRWQGMYAGDPSDAEYLLAHVESALATRTSKGPPTSQEMRDAIGRAYAALRVDLAATTILAPLGVTHSEFKKSGRHIFGDDYFRQICGDMRQIVVDAELIVFGFDRDHVAHILTSSREHGPTKVYGPCTSHDKLGFHAIGTGAFGAMTVLYATFESRSHKETESESIYRACEAFFRRTVG